LLRQFVARKEAVTRERTAVYQQPFHNQDFSAGLGDWAYQFATGCETPESVKPEPFQRLRVPVSLVWGEQDSITPLNQAKTLLTLMPRGRLTVLPNVGHIPHIEDVPAFNLVIRQVLQTPP
jgi:pimeloyl-ACP methyl ester carboxylesterase